MEIAHIYIYGDVGYWQSKDAQDWGEVTLTSVRDQYESQKNAESITLHIHSPGGYVTEGFAIHDYIRSLGKPVTAIIEGMCYSIATVIALAGDTRVMTSNSDFMIHNPWGMTGGDSNEVQKYADDLKKLEQKVADFYAAKTNLTSDRALELMKAETFMTPEDALKEGFITEIARVMKAVAYYKPKNKEKMSKEVLTKNEAETMLSKLGDRIKAFLDPKIKNKLIQDATGIEIDFTGLEDEQTPVIGDVATIEGSAAEGEYLLPNGETYVFVAGALTEIKPVEGGGDDSAEIAELKEQIDTLTQNIATKKSDVKALKKENKNFKNLLGDMQKEITAVKKSMGSDFKHDPEKKGKKKDDQGGRKLYKD